MRPFLLLAQQDPLPEPVDRLTALKEETVTFVQTNGLEFLTNLIFALLIFYLGKAAAGMLTRIVTGVMERARIDAMLVRFVSNIIFYGLLTVVVMAALERLGVQTTSLAAVLAAAGFAVGMALQGSLGNFASGVMLIIFRPFKTGDFIEAGGTAGIVEELSIFHTILKTPDNRRVIVPNGSITGGIITNHSHNTTRRIDLVIGCGYGDDLLAVKSFLQEVVDAEPRILDDPEPVIAVEALAESSVNFIVRPWVLASEYFAVKCDLTERIKLGFDERGFHFPFPSRDVYLHPADEDAS